LVRGEWDWRRRVGGMGDNWRRDREIGYRGIGYRGIETGE